MVATGPVLGRGVSRLECPLWVRSRHMQRKKPCPLYPRKQRQMRRVGMSALAQSGHVEACRRLLVGMVEHSTKRVVGHLIPEFKIQAFQVNLAALFSEHSRVKAPRFFWANLYEIPNRIRL